MKIPLTISVETKLFRKMEKLQEAWKLNRSQAYSRVLRAGLKKLTEEAQARREKKE